VIFLPSSHPSVLYIAFHYPPILGSSGVHRTLAFTRHLDSNGWNVRVLTASLKAYHNWSEEQFSFIPKNVQVIRAFARDVSRHFSWRGKYLRHMALPDNWQSWVVGGVVSGLISVIRHKPDVIVSTYPIASAHIIAYVLHCITGVPWVSDLRDPMAQTGYPSDPLRKKIYEWIERKIVKHCRFAIVTAPGAKVLYQQRFPEIADDFWQIIPNGYDEKLFDQLKPAAIVPSEDSDEEKRCVVLHSGLIYPDERDPSQLFSALSELKQEGAPTIEHLLLRLRATGNDKLYQQQIDQLNIADLVKLEPPVSYLPALEEMLGVDGLLLLQADNCNYQIPAKAYEYIRAQKPVLALTPASGDTGQLLAKVGVADISPLDDKEQIKIALIHFLEKIRKNEFVPVCQETIEQYSRQSQAVKFQALLEKVNSSEA
jgi:hypothetical protein